MSIKVLQPQPRITRPKGDYTHPMEILTVRLHEGASFKCLTRPLFVKVMKKVWRQIKKRKGNWSPRKRDWTLAHLTQEAVVDPMCAETGRYEVSVCDFKGNCITYLCTQYYCDDGSRFEECTRV